MRPLFSATGRAIASATSLTAVSQDYLDWGLRLAKRASRRLDAVFPIGCDIPTADASQVAAAGAKLRAVGVDPDKTICWFTGTFGATYDLGIIVEAARRFATLGQHHVQFVISGEGERGTAAIKAAAGLSNIVFTGWIEPAAILYLMKTVHIGLATYVKGALQSLPNKLFDYMAAGLPIVTSLTGEPRSLITQSACGTVYVGEDPDSFVDALRRLTDNEDILRRYSINSRELYNRRFTPGLIYHSLVDHLEVVRQSYLTGANSARKAIVPSPSVTDYRANRC